MKALLNSREQQRRDQESKLDALTATAAETNLPEARDAFFKKIAEAKAVFDKISQEIESLRNDASNHNAHVVDLSTAFKVLKEFRGNFHIHSVSDQAEVLRDVLAEIIMHEDEVELGLYGVEKPVVFSTPDGLKIDQNLGHNRTGVRPLFNLVEAKQNQAHSRNLIISFRFLPKPGRPFFKNVRHSMKRECRFER